MWGDKPGLVELPPHTRRRDILVAHSNIERGTTSAYAEKRIRLQELHQYCRNYLRIRGEELLTTG